MCLFLRYHGTFPPYKLIIQTTLTVVYNKNVLFYMSNEADKRKNYGCCCI